MHWFWLSVAAYFIGLVISLREMRAERPARSWLACVLASVAWPYCAIQRGLARLKREQPSQW